MITFQIRKGESIIIPAWGFHRDAQYFPNPLKFDPERFSEENKHNIQPFTYMPFGYGPRNCIGELEMTILCACHVRFEWYHIYSCCVFIKCFFNKQRITIDIWNFFFFFRKFGRSWIYNRSWLHFLWLFLNVKCFCNVAVCMAHSNTNNYNFIHTNYYQYKSNSVCFRFHT
jgi:hypothetical protein